MSQVPRLLKTIKPSRYRLSFNVDLAGGKFQVDQVITLTIARKARSLTLHAVNLDISRAWADGSNKATRISLDPKAQTARLEFAKELDPGEHQLEVTARGAIREGLHGLYRSRYEHEGAIKWLAVTQFEAVHAREAFVCVDEPAAKAVFEVSVTTNDTLTVMSNTANIREVTLQSGDIRHDFAPTPVMSTYLVAFVIGELDYVQRRSKAGVTVRAYGTPGRKPELAFAVETADRALTFLAEYFDIPYPLGKLDMVAIPDFGAGAMENWGLVTYRETELLLDPDHASLGNRQRVVEVIAHELAHQWFGNLVTMAWWNDLWLNEGFATWMEVFVQDHLYPEWDVWTQFVAGHYAHALDRDGLANTHPIEVEVDDPRELDEIFDAVSYSKGGAIINMLHGYLGDDAFRRGLQIYLKKHAYGNTTTDDLWKALGKASKLPVLDMMKAWTSQPGYPIVTLDGTAISQHRFIGSPREAATAQGYTWPVPLSGLLPSGQRTSLPLLDSQNAQLPEASIAKLNPGQTGFYRVQYADQQLDTLAHALTSGELATADRYGVVADVYATTAAGLTPSRTALNLTGLMRDEVNYVVWMAVSGGFISLLQAFDDESTRSKLKAYGRWLVEPNYARLSWDESRNDSYFDNLLRPVILQQATAFEMSEALAEAQRRFKSGREIHPDIRQAVYSGVARSGGTNEYERMLSLYKGEKNPQERMRLLQALCRFRDMGLIDRTLKLSLSDDVRAQDSIFVYAFSLYSHDAREATWDFIRAQWPTLVKLFGGGGYILEHLPYYLGEAFASQDRADEIRAFFADKFSELPGLVRPVAQAAEAIEAKHDWATRDTSDVQNFLADSPSP